MLQPQQTQVDFIDQGSGVEEVARVLPGHEGAGCTMKLTVDQRGQLMQGLVIAIVPGMQQERDIASSI
jgi:hypothetical protein